MRRIILLGQGRIALACLHHYTAHRSLGTGRLVALVADAQMRALAVDAALLPAEHIRDCGQRDEEALLNLIQATGAECLVSVQYPWILAERVLAAVGGEALNLHNAKLPAYRGHNALTHVLLNGDTQHTVTLHWMAPAVDRGHRCLEKHIPIAEDETAYSLWEKSSAAAVALFAVLLRDVENLRLAPRQSIDGVGTFYGRDSLAMLKRIPDRADVSMIDLWARAFHFPPHEPAFIQHPDGRRIYVVPGINKVSRPK